MTNYDFKTFAEAAAALKGAPKVQRGAWSGTTKIGNNTHAFHDTAFGQEVKVWHHETVAVRLCEDGTYFLDGGGWVSPSTARRMNDFTPDRFTLSVHRGEYVWTDRETGEVETFVRMFHFKVLPE